MSKLDYKKPFQIGEGFTQKFKNPIRNKSAHRSVILEYYAAGKLTQRDVRICEFLFKFNFATGDQIQRLIEGDEPTRNFRNRLNKLVEYRVLNAFSLFDENTGQAETMMVFCLDVGARYLIENFSTEEMLSWTPFANMIEPKILGKRLMMAELYVRLEQSIVNETLAFYADQAFASCGVTVSPDFSFSFENNGRRYNIIGDIVREYDYPVAFKKKVYAYESLLTTNGWKKYFREDDGEPMLIFLVEDDAQLKKLAVETSDLTRIEKVRFVTDERLRNDLASQGVFIEYDKRVETFRSGKIKAFDFEKKEMTE